MVVVNLKSSVHDCCIFIVNKKYCKNILLKNIKTKN